MGDGDKDYFTISQISAYVGVLALLIANCYMLFYPLNPQGNSQMIFALACLVAVGLVVYGWVDNVMM